MRRLTSTSSTVSDASWSGVTRCQRMAPAALHTKRCMASSGCYDSTPAAVTRRRVPRGEASRRAQCGKSACCVRRAGKGDGTAVSDTRALPRLYYLPLSIFCGRHLLAAKLRRSNIDGAAGAVEEVVRIVSQIRARWPRVRILLRADSGFCREELMAWCEANRVDYVFGLARNPHLTAEIATEMAAARATTEKTAKAARRFKDFRWSTLDSWSRIRRVIGKAEWTEGKANPRFIVTSLPAAAIDARRLYERIYCARGDMENRIKECQLDLFADRTSAATMRANQLRLWFASFAYVLLCALRRIGLAFTQFARASCGNIRLKLLKIGALVKISVRRVHVAMASACPYQHEFALAHALLRRAGA